MSLKGVTGAGHLDVQAVADKVAGIRQLTNLPITVGFGIKDAASATAVAQHCDGVVIGSALVAAVAGAVARGLTASDDLIAPGASLIGSIRTAVDSV